MNKLDTILEKFKSVNRPVILSDFKIVKTYQLNEIINHIFNQLKKLSFECGCFNIYDIFFINIDKCSNLKPNIWVLLIK